MGILVHELRTALGQDIPFAAMFSQRTLRCASAYGAIALRLNGLVLGQFMVRICG